MELPRRPTEICASPTRSWGSILRATTLQWCSKGEYVAVIQLSHASRTAAAAQTASFANVGQAASGAVALLAPARNSSRAGFYHGIHFPFLGSMSFRGMNLIQPSRLASFLSGTWPM